MLFNSLDFLFGLLPLTLWAHHRALRVDPRRAVLVLVVASMVYYGWWYWPYLALFLLSILVNYALGARIGDDARAAGSRRRLLQLGVVLNLGVLGFYKYLGWLGDSLAAVTGWEVHAPHPALPIGISFFTFQQIAWLVDARRGKARASSLLDYALFVSFFPQLIAGPIVHHDEMMPQFARGRPPDAHDRAVGATMFVAGLAKKVLVADPLVPYVSALFDGVHAGQTPGLWDAWVGLLAWHFQLYFDFSGYSDMALGLGRLFGIRLPVNFEAPYRATSMIDFWRRWHLTLTRFLRDYLYFSLGGNRSGGWRHLRNLFLTIWLAGIWHGAGWTFFLWGLQMGVYQVVNAWWSARGSAVPDTLLGRALGRASVWLCLIFSWPLFRGQTVADAVVIWRSMIGLDGAGRLRPWVWVGFACLAAFVLIVPTLQQWMRDHEPAEGWKPIDTVTWTWRWQPTIAWATAAALLFAATVPVLERANAFLYWNF
ncbi:MAG TPA: MBOAT family O-acyltransferase [Myxococcota bacterium]|nr:MBOAT family O-acyltransferase [Myxococcota bacterium]